MVFVLDGSLPPKTSPLVLDEHDPNSPFHCIITNEEEIVPITWILGELGQNCNEVCGGIGSTCTVPDIDSLDELRTKMGELGHENCTPQSYSSDWAALGPLFKNTPNEPNTCILPDGIGQETYVCEAGNPNFQSLCKCQS